MTDSPWRCAGCNIEGRISTIASGGHVDPRPILRVVFGGGPNDAPRLLCALCRPSEVRQPDPQPQE
jgi:hypothetical protein